MRVSVSPSSSRCRRRAEGDGDALLRAADTPRHASPPGAERIGQPSAPVDLDGERRLAAAIFERAAADLAGGHVRSVGHVPAERHASAEAEEWVLEAEDGFRFWCWCDVAGRDWRDVRGALLRRRGQPYLRTCRGWLTRH